MEVYNETSVHSSVSHRADFHFSAVRVHFANILALVILALVIIGHDLHQFSPSKYVNDHVAGLFGRNDYGRHNNHRQ